MENIDWNEVWQKLIDLGISVGTKILWALLVLIVGKILIKVVMSILRKTYFFKKAETTVARFLLTFIKVVLEILLIVTIVAILGVPMSSMVALIAAAGATIGLALQGALSNFAGGIMILIFHPFRLEDFVEAGGLSGTVKDIGIFYTVLTTPDNKDVTIPNGTIMAQPVTNYTAHDIRRLDLNFSVAFGTDLDKVQAVLLDVGGAHELVVKEPAPFARLSAHTESSLTFTLRVWVKCGDYWTVHFDLIEAVNKRFALEGIRVPYNQLDVHLDTRKPDGNDAPGKDA